MLEEVSKDLLFCFYQISNAVSQPMASFLLLRFVVITFCCECTEIREDTPMEVNSLFVRQKHHGWMANTWSLVWSKMGGMSSDILNRLEAPAVVLLDKWSFPTVVF